MVLIGEMFFFVILIRKMGFDGKNGVLMKKKGFLMEKMVFFKGFDKKNGGFDGKMRVLMGKWDFAAFLIRKTAILM
jgi:hypothetical protein